MKVGKVPETILKRSVFKQLKSRRKEVLLGPGIGLDCSFMKLEADEVVVVSSDPITSTMEDIGSLSVYITVNDLASGGAEPVGLMLTVLLPPNFSEKKLKNIMQEVNQTCEQFNVQVIGGHTEVTRAVNQPIISVTGIGKIKEKQLKQLSGPEIGQDIVMTKWAGLEGTAIIAKEKESELKTHYYPDFIEGAKSLGSQLSILKESEIAVAHGATSMHDITEGGVFGALWELGASKNVGMKVFLDQIPIKQETIEICEYYDLNPYKLISSGSLLITIDDSEKLVKELLESNIQATVIGKITDGNERIVIQSDSERSLEPAKADELYKIL